MRATAAEHSGNSCREFVTERRTHVARLLLEIEVEMRRLRLWESEPPSSEALQSQLPFCYDTLYFTQWLQFVFLVRMRQLLEGGVPLPVQCGIAPMAEECFKNIEADTHRLLKLLAEIDAALTDL